MISTFISIFSTILGKYSKAITLSLLFLLILSGGILWYQNERIIDLKVKYQATVLSLEELEKTYKEEQARANEAISYQNDRINEYRLNIEEYTRTIAEREKELLEARYQEQEQVKEELRVDPSVDNQLRIVDRILKEIANGL